MPEPPTRTTSFSTKLFFIFPLEWTSLAVHYANYSFALTRRLQNRTQLSFSYKVFPLCKLNSFKAAYIENMFQLLTPINSLFEKKVAGDCLLWETRHMPQLLRLQPAVKYRSSSPIRFKINNTLVVEFMLSNILKYSFRMNERTSLNNTSKFCRSLSSIS